MDSQETRRVIFERTARRLTTPTSQTTLAPSEHPAPSEDSLTCLNCREPLELVRTGGRTVLVTKLSGDLGGTYDQCEATPFDELEGTYGLHKRAR
jgi:hypothetical protein